MTAPTSRRPRRLSARLGARLGAIGLAPRLFLSGLLIVAAGAVTLPVVALLLAPALFHEHLQRAHLPQVGDEVRGHVDAAFEQAVLLSLAAAVTAATVAAATISWLVARRLASPVHDVADAARRLADGHYDVRVPDPRLGPEFASVADSMTRLSRRLAVTEADRRQLTAELAHQLRTPLSAVRATAEALVDGVLVPDEATLTALADQADRLGRLVVDLEKVSRAEERQIVLDPAPQPLAPLVERATAAVGGLFRAKGVDLTTAVDPATPAARVDPGRLAEILGNLLDNALRHTPPGGTVTVALRPGAAATGRNVEIVVSDTGDGFEPGHAELLFQRFHRGPRTDPGGGSGLGLTIARALTEAHNGTLTASSDGPGRGSTFTLALPPFS